MNNRTPTLNNAITRTIGQLGDVYEGIGNFPVLLLDGQNVLSESEAKIDAKMKAKGTKNFICYTADESTVYMGQVMNKTIYEMPQYLKDTFGCHNAINLDAGGSLSLIYNGKYIS
jgi:exopolysaccharide biosynthesis protein